MASISKTQSPPGRRSRSRRCRSWAARSRLRWLPKRSERSGNRDLGRPRSVLLKRPFSVPCNLFPIFSPEPSMNIHEYQAKALLKEFGVPLGKGAPAFTPDEAVKAAEAIGGSVWVVK